MKRAVGIAAAAAVLAALGANVASANDGVYGGNGTHPMPLTTGDVEMVEEHVVLTFNHERRAWEVRCDFWFENKSDQTVKLQVGFPFPVYNPDHGDISVPKKAKEPKAGRPLVWDFQTKVRGKKVKVRETRTVKNPKLPDLDYEFAYLWDAEFKPGEKVQITNTYTHGEALTVDGTMGARYVLKTGGLWKGGKIGRSRLELHVPHPRIVLCADHMASDGGSVVKPAGGKVSTDAKGLHIHWDLKNFAPKEDLEVCLYDLDQGAHMMFAGLVDADLAAMDKKALRILRNEVYALHGYVFKSKDLQDHFAKEWWYRPDPSFKADRLTKEQREFVRKIKAEEAKR